MHTLRRLLAYISTHVDLDPENCTVKALQDMLDYFKRYPKEYMELFK